MQTVLKRFVTICLSFLFNPTMYIYTRTNKSKNITKITFATEMLKNTEDGNTKYTTTDIAKIKKHEKNTHLKYRLKEKSLIFLAIRSIPNKLITSNTATKKKTKLYVAPNFNAKYENGIGNNSIIPSNI